MSDEMDFSAIINVAREWHYRECRSVADDAIQACVGTERIRDRAVREIHADALASDPPRTEEAARIWQDNPREVYGLEREPEQDVHEFLTEWVDSTTDQHNHVIYTAKAKMILLASDNEDAYENDIGDMSGVTVEARACFAMRADVWEILNARSDEWTSEACARRNATFEINIELDDTPVRGNALASGDASYDKLAEDEIIARLDLGDVWAWCVVTVKATYGDHEGTATLGACSYESREMFEACDYFKSLKDDALEDLISNL